MMAWIRSLIALLVLACPPASAQLRMLFAENEEATHLVDASTYIRSSEERHGTAEPPKQQAQPRTVRVRDLHWSAKSRMRLAAAPRRRRQLRRRLLYGQGDNDEDA